MIEDKDLPAAPKTNRETIERWHAPADRKPGTPVASGEGGVKP